MRDENTGTSLSDMLTYCLLHWRSAIVVVLCGVLAGGAITWLHKDAAEIASIDDTSQSTEDELGSDALQSLDSQAAALEVQREALARLASYYADSTYMGIDARKESFAVASLIIGVSAYEPANASDAIASAYQTQLRTGPEFLEIAKETDISPAYLRELITVNVSNSGIDSGATQSSDVVVPDESEGSENQSHVFVLTVRVVSSTQEQAIQWRDALLANIESYHESIAADTFAHSLRVANKAAFTVADRDLLTLQSKTGGTVADARAKLASAEKTLANLQASVESESAEVDGSGTVSRASMLKTGIIGGAIMPAFYGLLLCIWYVWGTSPQVRRQIAERYNLPDVGSFTYGKSNFYKHNLGLDRWLRSLADMDNAPDADEALEMILANVRLYADDCRTILVSSSNSSSLASELCDKLSAATDDYVFELGNRLIESPNAREALKRADAVIFVEEYGKSTFKRMDGEILLVAEIGKKPLGLVMA